MRVAELGTAESLGANEPLAEWAERRIRLERRPFQFEGHEYLRAIYDDKAPHIVLAKAAQIGGTTWAILRSFHACLSGLNVMYFFPTRTDVLEFSKSRVGPLLMQNPFLSREVRDTDTAGLKQIGEAYLYLRGMQSAVGMKSVPADMIVFDELDEASPDAKAMARERLSHSDYRRIIELSNPSLPGYGIDEAFRDSDQRYWTIKCSSCGRWTDMVKEFPKRMGEEVRILKQRPDGTWYRSCARCDTELDIAAGEWVAVYPDRLTHGYLISQLVSSKVDPAEIMREYRRTRHPARFYNLKVGIPWVEAENRLTVPQILALCGDAGMEESSNSATTMGVDTGKELHVVIGQKAPGAKRRRILWIGVCQAYVELDDLMRRFQVNRCVIDALPEIHATREFARRHPGRVYCNYFLHHQKGAVKWNKEEYIVQENRTEALDSSRMAIRREEVVLPRQSKIVETFAEQLTHDVKRLEEDEETGAQEYRYVRTGTDHFSLAFTYEVLAAGQSGTICAVHYGGYSATAGRESVAISLRRESFSTRRRSLFQRLSRPTS